MQWLVTLGGCIGGFTFIYGLVKHKKLFMAIGAVIYAIAFAMAWNIGG